MRTRSTSIEFRASIKEKERLNEAARNLGLDLSSFIRMIALREAAAIERDQNRLVLSDADRRAFLKALDDDPEPTAALVDIFRN